MEQIFIAREQQLKQLHECLSLAVSGQGRVCFVSGEAGSGKTTLVNEFVKRSQAADKTLAVAVGLCDAQTGVGDAYLPFREVLGQLTGDVEGKLAQGAITQENAGRLRNMLVLAGQAIVDVGPDLIGVFVPGVGLATKLGAFVAEKVGWLDKLEKLVNKPKDKPGESGIQESHIFEQFANVLCRISEKHPLLIILDDLHWGDAASINLLFHLGRRIGQHRILILGTYRSAEVAIGRGGERHPLEKVLAEFKRYFGDITLDLDKAVEEEGKQFVEAFLESEPNNLKDDFITNLYHHTGGHPLFTVELLRNLQERGDLVKDKDNRWVESASLNWDDLPTKVEGVIEERIGRLQAELKQTLTIGSVQGEDFTAEVVARVQQAEAGGLIRKLSGELERQHRLVHAEGIRRLDPGGQRLSLFRFQHNLFRTYLYNEMSEAERAYLHEDVGNALESLYGQQADEIAVQLALHFEKAGVDEKARHYLQKAGEQASARYANEEAIAYFTRALEMTPDKDAEKRFELLMLRERLLSSRMKTELQKQDLEELEKLVERLNDDRKKANFAMRRSSYCSERGDYQLSEDYARKALSLSELIDDPELLSSVYLKLGNITKSIGEYQDALQFIEKSLSISQKNNYKQITISDFASLGEINQNLGKFDESRQCFEKAIELANELGNENQICDTLIKLGVLFMSQGNSKKMLECNTNALDYSRKIGDLSFEACALANIGVVYAIQGELKKAYEVIVKSMDVWKKTGKKAHESGSAGNLSYICIMMGNLELAEHYSRHAVNLARETGSKSREAVNLELLSMILGLQGDYQNAIDCCRQALQVAKETNNQEYVMSIYSSLGILLDKVGRYEEADTSLMSCLPLAIEMQHSIEPVCLSYLSLIFHHMGQPETSLPYAEQAINLSREKSNQDCEANALMHLGFILIDLNRDDEAKDWLEKSETLRIKLAQHHLAMEPKAGLAEIAIQEENFGEALGYVEQILDHLKTGDVNGTDEPMRIYRTCYQVLKAAGDPRAEEILTHAHTILMERAGKITDEAMRTSYLENVAANKQIVEAFNQRGESQAA